MSILCYIVLYFPISVRAACPIDKPSTQSRIIRLSERLIIMSHFDPSTRILSYLKKTRNPSDSYEELIQQTHALTLTVSELHKLRTIDSSLYEHIHETFQTFLITLEHNKTKLNDCTAELDSLIAITQQNIIVSQELLLNRLPRYQRETSYR